MYHPCPSWPGGPVLHSQLAVWPYYEQATSCINQVALTSKLLEEDIQAVGLKISRLWGWGSFVVFSKPCFPITLLLFPFAAAVTVCCPPNYPWLLVSSVPYILAYFSSLNVRSIGPGMQFSSFVWLNFVPSICRSFNLTCVWSDHPVSLQSCIQFFNRHFFWQSKIVDQIFPEVIAHCWNTNHIWFVLLKLASISNSVPPCGRLYCSMNSSTSPDYRWPLQVYPAFLSLNDSIVPTIGICLLHYLRISKGRPRICRTP